MYDEGNRETRSVKTITSTLPYNEWLALKALAKRNHVRPSEYVRAIIIDAIAEEQAIVLQRLGTQGCAASGEASKASGAIPA